MPSSHLTSLLVTSHHPSKQPSVGIESMILEALIILIVVLVARVLWVLRGIRQGRRTSSARPPLRSQPLKTLIILGSGGHTTEMLALTKHLPTKYYRVEYCVANTDTTSAMRLPPGQVLLHRLPRAREVGQSYWTSVFTTLYALLHALVLVARIRPGLVLSNGPGTALPVCLAAFSWRVVGWCEGKVVFCESYCRVQTLSFTGKLLYYWADVFVVHWKELHQRYPQSSMVTTFVKG